MDVRVLGPVEVCNAGSSQLISGRQHRLILGVLAIEANSLVPCDRLVDLVWGEDPPRKARAVIQSRVSELRGALARMSCRPGNALLPTRGNGYTLRIAPERVDALQFKEIKDRWRTLPSYEEARSLLREALALWRGPIFGGVMPAGANSSIYHSLESARLTAIEDLFDIELRLGNHCQVIDEILEWSNTNPTRERLVGHMMLALHLSGRTIEALKAYDRWWRWVRDEVGVEPGAQLQDLHRAILRNQAIPVQRSTVPRPSSNQVA